MKHGLWFLYSDPGKQKDIDNAGKLINDSAISLAELVNKAGTGSHRKMGNPG